MSSGQLEIRDGGNFIFNSNTATSSLTSNVFAGTEIFHPNSNVIIKGLDTGVFLSSGVLSAISTNSDNAYFGNIIVDYTNGSNNFILIGSGTYTSAQFQKAICNDLIFRTSNNQNARIYQPTTNYIQQANPLKILGNFIIEPSFQRSISFTTQSPASVSGNNSYYFLINKDFIHNLPK